MKTGSCFFVLALFVSAGLFALPSQYAPAPQSSFNSMQEALQRLLHEVKNQDERLTTLKSQMENQESTLENVQKQVLESIQNHKDAVRSSLSAAELKIANLESKDKSFSYDIKQVKDHSNETAQALNQCKQKLAEVEKNQKLIQQDLKHIEAAVNALMEALQLKNPAAESRLPENGKAKTYKVKPGDSLEKIARQNATSVSAIKEINQMSDDKIVVGKTILIP